LDNNSVFQNAVRYLDISNILEPDGERFITVSLTDDIEETLVSYEQDCPIARMRAYCIIGVSITGRNSFSEILKSIVYTLTVVKSINKRIIVEIPRR